MSASVLAYNRRCLKTRYKKKPMMKKKATNCIHVNINTSVAVGIYSKGCNGTLKDNVALKS